MTSELSVFSPPVPFNAFALLSRGDIEAAQDFGPEFNTVRLESFQQLQKKSFPTAHDELWRYTRPDQFNFKLLKSIVPPTCRVTGWQGVSLEQLQKQGVDVATTPEEVSALAAKIKEVTLGRTDVISYDPIADLQLAVASPVIVVRIRKGRTVSDIISLEQLAGKQIAAAPLIVILVERGASATVVEDLCFEAAGLYFPRVEVLLEDGAQFDFVSLQRIGREANYLGRHRIHAGRDVTARFFHAFSGAKVSRIELDLHMNGPGSSIDLNSVYVGDGKQHIDLHPTQYHHAPQCRSNLLSKGVMKGASRAVYYGYIRVDEGAQKTDAYQQNRNMILSPDAHVDSIPNLAIKANDVKCSHGSSAGQMNLEELFYLMSRGLSREQSEKLMVEGFLSNVLQTIRNETLRNYTTELFVGKLNDTAAL